MSKDNKFKFVMPAELVKGKNGAWKVKGLASTQGIDMQGETIVQKGMDLTPIDQRKGVLNWDHKKGPENTIGVLDGYSRGENGLYVEGRLFKNHDKAKSVQQIMSSLGEEDGGRMGLSVEGQILERDPINPKIIRKCRINAVALTMNPVNSNTYAGLVKSMTGSEELEFDAIEENITGTSEESTFSATQVMAIVKKALGVGAGYTQAPNELTDGSAMATSDMKPAGKKDKKKKKEPIKVDDLNVQKASKLRVVSEEIYKSMMINVLEKLQVLYPGCTRSELWEAVKGRLESTFPNIYAASDEN